MDRAMIRPIEQSEWGVMREQATVLIGTGFLPEAIKTAEQAIAIMMKARELGLPPMYGLSNIVVIKGKPAASAELMLALIYRDHGDEAIRFTETNAQKCTIRYKRRNWAQPESYSFTSQDAEAAGLLSNNTWKQYRPAMLRARCISAVARMGFPDTIGGLYTPEELGASVSVSDAEEMMIHSPIETIPSAAPSGVNTETGEMTQPVQIAPPKPAQHPATPSQPGRRAVSRQDLATRYQGLVDKADVVEVPAKTYDPSWSDQTLIDEGMALNNRIAAKEAQLAKAG